jgi:hypothetical protein
LGSISSAFVIVCDLSYAGGYFDYFQLQDPFRPGGMKMSRVIKLTDFLDFTV